MKEKIWFKVLTEYNPPSSCTSTVISTSSNNPGKRPSLIASNAMRDAEKIC